MRSGLASNVCTCPRKFIPASSNSKGSDDMEASAESEGSVESSTMSDSYFKKVSEKPPQRSLSTETMLTSDSAFKYDEALDAARELDGSEPESSDNEGTMNPMILEDRTWTNDKHCSYLNSIEASFVRSLYGQARDSEQDCAESRLSGPYSCCTSTPLEYFKLLQGGSYEQKAYYHPQMMEPAFPYPAVLASPWIRHFKPKGASNPAGTFPTGQGDAVLVHSRVVIGGMRDSIGERKELVKGRQTQELMGVDGDGKAESSEEQDCEGGAEVPDTDQGLRFWQHRFQSHAKRSGSASGRQDSHIMIKTRKFNAELRNAADIYPPKIPNTTRQELALKNADMLKQCMARQRCQAEAEASGCKLEHGPGDEQLRKHDDRSQPIANSSAENGRTSLSASEAVQAAQDRDICLMPGRSWGKCTPSDLDQVVPSFGKAEIEDGKNRQVEEKQVSEYMNTTMGREMVSPAAAAVESTRGKQLGQEETSTISASMSSSSGDEGDERKFNQNMCSYTVRHGNNPVLSKHMRRLDEEVADDLPKLQGRVGVQFEKNYKTELQVEGAVSSKAQIWTWGLQGLRRRNIQRKIVKPT